MASGLVSRQRLGLAGYTARLSGVTIEALLKLGVLWPPSLWAESGSGSLATPRARRTRMCWKVYGVLLQCGATFHLPSAKRNAHALHLQRERACAACVCTWSESARCARTTDGTKKRFNSLNRCFSKERRLVQFFESHSRNGSIL